MSSAPGEAVLGLDTATAVPAVAVTVAAVPAYESSLRAPGDGERPAHAATLLGEVERAVEAAGGWERIGLIAVGVGPGTFTGLRIGVSTARALAQARDLDLAAVSSLEALARGIGARHPDRARLALLDARRGELFAALYAADDSELAAPFVGSPEAIVRAVGHGLAPVAAGDGSLRFRDQLEAAGIEVLADEDPAHRMAARHICALGAVGARAAGAPPQRPEAVKPVYLRRPDAELWREQRDRDTDPGGT